MTKFQRVSGVTAILAFLAIYPGFFFYHYLAGVEAIPLFAGGWASNTNVATALLLAPMAALTVLRSGRYAQHLLAAAFVSLIFGYGVLFCALGSDYQRGSELLVEVLKLCIGIAALYCVGFLLPSDRLLGRVLGAAFVLMAIGVGFGTDWSALAFDIPERVVPSGQVSDYLGFATAFAVTALMLAAWVQSSRWVYLVAAVTGTCMFLIGARGDMVGAACASIALAFVAFAKRQYLRSILLPTAYILPILVLIAAPSIAEMIPDGAFKQSNQSAPAARHQRFEGSFRNQELFALNTSQSLSIRLEVLESGWRGIAASPITGDYAGQVRDHGMFGMYIHNLLSAWRQFGLAGLILYLGVGIGGLLYATWWTLVKGDHSFLMVTTLLLSVYAVSLIFLTKSVFWPMPALAWGLYAAARLSKYEQKCHGAD